LKALREGFMLAMQLVLIGSLLQVIASFPLESFTKWLHQTGLELIFNNLISNSFGLIALLTCFGVAYRLDTSYKVDG
ncbi:PTS transporter subunit EIIC, partial [Lactobacillus jensenii]|uniref:PTS transporter subunit EIIC n=1 Tax=Lactobacillus jensenii TaxID=109790 RepID=UPI002870818A